MHNPPEPPRLERFEILDLLGSGNTGTIWKARARVAVGALQPGALVALKVLHPSLIEDQDARRTFLREARAGMAVRHPHLVRVFAVEEVRRGPRRLLYLVLEYLSGRTVRRWLQEEGLAGEPTLRTLGRQVAGALAALHEAGLLHLDVKPENTLWQPDRAVLLDLGFVRPGAQPTRREAGGPDPPAALLTSSSSEETLFVGTPAYAAPEVLRGERPSPAADLFSLGVTLYECATGMRPYGDEYRHGLFAARASTVVRKPSALQPRLSPFFDTVVLALLEEDPARRIASARALETILTEAEHGSWWREHGAVEPILPLIHPGALPFQDREAAMGLLLRAWQAARRDGRPRAVVLSGPPETGKSRIALEFGLRRRSRPDAPPFLYGRCLRLGRGSALRAVRDALARSLGLHPDEGPNRAVEHRLRAALPPGAAETLIGLLHRQPIPRERRRRAFLEWFRALGREGPFLVLMDDLHATGGTLWEFLGRVLDLEEVPALFLLAHRNGLEADAAAARRAFLRRPRVRNLEIGPLPVEEMRRLLRRCFRSGGLPPSWEEDLLAAARGRPGVLHELLRYLRARQALTGSLGDWVLTRRDARLPLTPDHEDILRAELRALPREDRELLRWAACLAPPLRVRLLAAIRGAPEARVARRLAELAESGWLEVFSGRYRFARPTAREAVYRSMDEAERRRRHARIFRVLADTELPVPHREAALAFHAHRAALHEEAVRHGIPVIERHLLQAAWDRAAGTLEVVAEHARAAGLEDLDPALRCRLLVLEAWLAGHRRDPSRELRLLQRAARLAMALEDDALRRQVHLGLARHAHRMGFQGAARIHVQRARELNPAPAPPPAPGSPVARDLRASGSSGRSAGDAPPAPGEPGDDPGDGRRPGR